MKYSAPPPPSLVHLSFMFYNNFSQRDIQKCLNGNPCHHSGRFLSGLVTALSMYKHYTITPEKSEIGFHRLGRESRIVKLNIWNRARFEILFPPVLDFEQESRIKIHDVLWLHYKIRELNDLGLKNKYRRDKTQSS